ncbi:MAG: hypothetical protein IJJ00_07465 [Erysipelotrichaceae bacterium]|nr:hypothetical protein [Erysipelotrichaceae bacterium]
MKTRKLFTSLLLVLLCLFTARPVKAEEGAPSPRTYKVTISGGLHGKIDGKDIIEFEVPQDYEWNMNDYLDRITLNSSEDEQRYYFKGFHISGRDDLIGTKTISEDTVFVATYGIKGETAEYHVHYLDGSGNTLHEPQTFYGNVGDRPVIAYVHVEGYEPEVKQYNDIVLGQDPVDITFTYKPAQSGNTVIYVEVPGETPNTPSQGGGGTAPEENIPDETTPAADPDDIVDIDTDPTPTTKPDDGGKKEEVVPQKTGFLDILKTYALPGLGILALLLLIIFLIFRRRKGQNAS